MHRILIGVGASMLVSTIVSAQQATFVSGIELVRLGVSVLDDEGNPINGLGRDDFEVYEDGSLQDIQFFSQGVESSDTLPIHVGVLFDASGSMEEDGRFAKTAAIKFLNTLTYAEDMTLVDFDTEVRVGRYGQADFPRLVERIRGQRPGGMTAFYDALGVYLDGAFEQDGRKVLLIYSDGEDTRSRMRFADVLDLLQASDVTVYAIGFQKQLPSSARPMQRMRLGQMASMTGGRSFFPTDADALDGIYEEIVREIEARYALGYVSTNTRTDGTWREVDVQIRMPDDASQAPEIRTRSGYYAPYRDDAQPLPR